ncbi:MAG: hypothetical protein IPP51_10390 [Bacteroidetes bacterium]|nr:hypothetical protein [Bacteroidota bacterium]
MKSIFEPTTRAEVVKRIDALTSNNKALWGKMTVAQMVRHCSICEEYYFGNIEIKRSFIGRIFGQKAIRSILKDENSMLQKMHQLPRHFW